MRQISSLWHEKIQEIFLQKIYAKTIHFYHHKERRRYYIYFNTVQSICGLMLVGKGRILSVIGRRNPRASH